MIQRLTSDDGPFPRPHESYSLEPAAFDPQPHEGGSILIRQSSLRSRRRQFTLAITAFTLGAAVLLMQSPVRNDFLAPGPLTFNHAQLLADQGTERCAACHSVGNQGISQWLKNAFLPGRAVQACQSELCMKCHQESLPVALATKPHNVDPHELARISARLNPNSPNALHRDGDSGNDIQCSACHREHHGQVDLTHLTDQQCQSCHAISIASFEFDHPEFSNWPQQRRSAIAFDHVSHSQSHFRTTGETFDCKACHVADGSNNVQRLLPYEQSCARCHDSRIVSRGEPGLLLVNVPMLDLDAIAGQQLSVGQWPENATGDFDGPISGLMRLLLFSDDRAAKILNRRGGNFDFSELDSSLEQDVSDAVELAWSIKYLMFDLASEGMQAIRPRLEFVLGRPIATAEFDALIGGLDTRSLASTARQWFPRLDTEVPMHRVSSSGSSTAIFRRIAPKFARIADQDDAELLAVNPLVQLMESERHPGGSQKDREPSDQSSLSDLSDASDTPAFAGPENNVAQSSAPTSRPDIPESELLAVNPIRDYRNEAKSPETAITNQAAVPDAVPDGKGQGQANIGRAVGDNSPTLGATAIDETARPPIPDLVERHDGSNDRPADHMSPSHRIDAPLMSEQRFVPVTTGGWIRDDHLFQIKYLASEHADPVVVSWFNVIATTPQSSFNAATAMEFGKMTSDTSWGGCNDCHTVDSMGNTAHRVNWQPIFRDPLIKAFTEFSHGPHLIQPQLTDCTGCHVLDSGLTNAHTFKHFDAKQAISNFAPITKSNCAMCHNSSAVDSSCTQCHNYHVGSKAVSAQ